ncbi:MAG: hypothetical protein J0L92_25045 [Deltaproteobacteria bacterium]|nr:hypothetical protein [Deltaproteobacteria bacterium]
MSLKNGAQRQPVAMSGTSENNNSNEKTEKTEKTIMNDENNELTSAAPNTSGLDASFYAALHQVGDELLAIPAAKLLPVNLEIHAAVVTALGCQPELEAHRASVREWFGDDWAAMIDALPTYAKAAAQAHGEFLASQTSSTEINAVSKELTEMRELLVTDLTSLVNRKRVDAAVLSGLRGSVGFRNQVTDVVQLTSVFRRQWATVKDVTPVTIADLERAESLAAKLTRLLGVREQGSLEATGIGEMRQRAFTKFVGTYDQLRRAMTFLRWDEEDVDSIIPSLWAGRGGRGKRSDVEVIKTEPTKVEPKKDPNIPDLPSPFIDEADVT